MSLSNNKQLNQDDIDLVSTKSSCIRNSIYIHLHTGEIPLSPLVHDHLVAWPSVPLVVLPVWEQPWRLGYREPMEREEEDLSRVLMYRYVDIAPNTAGLSDLDFVSQMSS